MVKIFQYQSPLSHTTHMRVDRGANCHVFWDDLLFYVLFVRPTYVHVAGGSTFSADGVGLVPVTFPGSLTLHSLDPSYWTFTDLTSALFRSALKLYDVF